MRHDFQLKMFPFNLAFLPHLGCWDGIGNDVPAAVASLHVLHWASSSVPAAREALRCRLVRGRAEAPCRGGPPVAH